MNNQGDGFGHGNYGRGNHMNIPPELRAVSRDSKAFVWRLFLVVLSVWLWGDLDFLGGNVSCLR